QNRWLLVIAAAPAIVALPLAIFRGPFIPAWKSLIPLAIAAAVWLGNLTMPLRGRSQVHEPPIGGTRLPSAPAPTIPALVGRAILSRMTPVLLYGALRSPMDNGHWWLLLPAVGLLAGAGYVGCLFTKPQESGGQPRLWVRVVLGASA